VTKIGSHTTSQCDPSAESRVDFAVRRESQRFHDDAQRKVSVGQDARTVYSKVTERLPEVE
jgi:hypothetical protein